VLLNPVQWEGKRPEEGETTMTNRILFAGASLAALIAPISRADAADQTVQSGAARVQQAVAVAGAQPVAPGDIIVTAQKRSERLQDVPMSITALSTDSLSSRGQVRISDYLSQVPGLAAYSSSAGQTTLAIRGITTGGHNNPTVGITVDDIPLGSSILGTYGDQLTPELDPAAISQIEVLRGPQGTLYGAASLGGLVRYVTTAPDPSRFSGRVEIGGTTVAHGSQGGNARASVNVPLASNLAVSVSGFYRRDPGYVDDASRGLKNLDYADVYGGRVALLWKPADMIKIRLAALVNATDGNGVSDVDGDANLHPISPYNQTRVEGSGAYHRLIQFYTSNIDVDLGAATFTSATGYERNRYSYLRDYSPIRGAAIQAQFGPGTTGTVNFRVPSWKVSQEFRVTGETGHLLDWQLGFFYNHEVGRPHFTTEVTNIDTGAFIQNYTTDYYPTIFSEYAGFANLDYHLSSRFDVQGGFRYSWNNQEYTETVLGGPNVVRTPSFTHNVSKDTSWTYAISPRFKITPGIMVYGRVSTGYRPGGPNTITAVGVPTQYSADTTTNYEVGFKGSMFDRRLTLDVSAFWIDWKDIQIQLRDPATNLIFFQNAGKARSKGVEATATAKPWNGMSVNATLGYTDARLRDGLPNAPGSPAAGDRLPFSAKWTGSVSADQYFPLSPSWRGFVGASYNYIGARANGFTAVGTKIMPAYQTVDLRAGAISGPYRISLYVQNVTDEVGITAADPRSTVATSPYAKIFAMSLIRPRTIGISIARTF
jgi:outer membrane receptor protein involved in Fe transport